MRRSRIKGPVPASPAPRPTPEERTHEPTNARPPGAGITRSSEGQATQASCRVRARSSRHANPQRNTGTEALERNTLTRTTGPEGPEQSNYQRDTGTEAPEQATTPGHTATRNATYRRIQGLEPLSEPLRHDTQQQARQPNLEHKALGP